MSELFEMKGNVAFIFDAESFQANSKTITKRRMILSVPGSGPYPKESRFEFEAFGDTSNCMHNLQQGNSVTVKFEMSGREWQNQNTGKTSYFVSLKAKEIFVANGQPQQAASNQGYQQQSSQQHNQQNHNGGYQQQPQQQQQPANNGNNFPQNNNQGGYQQPQQQQQNFNNQNNQQQYSAGAPASDSQQGRIKDQDVPGYKKPPVFEAPAMPSFENDMEDDIPFMRITDEIVQNWL